MKYKIGDKVRVRKDLVHGKVYAMNDGITKDSVVSEMMGFAGKIVTIERAEEKYRIKGCSYNFTDKMLEPVNTQKIVITSDGVETLARLYDGNKVVKTATAKCSPDDTFDFETGARFAFDRLIESPLTKSLKKLSEAVANVKIPSLNFGVKTKPQTFREKLKQEHPEKVGTDYCGGCFGCPHEYRYESRENRPCKDNEKMSCRECWDRVIPSEKPLKFEVGKQYQGEDFVIEITSAEKLPHDVRYRFNAIKGNAGNLGFFDECSVWGGLLKPYDPPKYYNGKVVCVEKGHAYSYTVGKVYEFKDGKVKIDNGNTVCAERVKTLDEWNEKNGHYAKFIPFVE